MRSTPTLHARLSRDAEGFRRSVLWACIAAAVLALLVSWPSVRYGLVYDDVSIVGQDKRLADPGFIAEVWRAPWWPEGSLAPASRPLTTLTFWAEVQALGRQPWHFHLVNILLFAGCAAGVAALAGAWSKRPAVAWLAGGLFAVHPIHVEVMDNVVGRAELIPGLLMLGGLICYVRWRKQPLTWRRAGVLGLFVLLAGLGKEHGYFLAAMYGAVEFAERWREGRVRPLRDWPWKLAAVIVVVAAVAVGQREAMLHGAKIKGGQVAQMDNPLAGASAADRLVTPLKILGQAAELAVWPVGQSPDYSPQVMMPTHDLGDPRVLAGLGVLLAWGAGTVWAWRRKRWVLGPLLLVPVAWFIPSNTVLVIGTIFGERLLFTVSMFVSLVAGATLVGAMESERRKPAAIGLAAAALGFAAMVWVRWEPYYQLHMLDGWLPWSLAVLVAGALAAAMRSRRMLGTCGATLLGLVAVSLGSKSLAYGGAWQNMTSLTFTTAERVPRSCRFQAAIAEQLLEMSTVKTDERDRILDEAWRRANQALEAWPQQFDPYRTLAAVAELRGNHKMAKEYLKFVSGDVPVYGGNRYVDHVLAGISGSKSEPQLKAIAAAYEKQLEQSPDDKGLLLKLAQTYQQLNERKKAADIYGRVVTPQTTDPKLLETYGEALIDASEFDKAVALYRRIARESPQSWSMLTDAAMIVVNYGKNPEEARPWIEQAMRLSPGSAEPWAARAQLRQKRGDLAGAITAYGEAMKRCAPNDPRRPHYQFELERLKRSVN